MKIRMLKTTKVAANEFGSETVLYKEGRKYDSGDPWQAQLHLDLVAADLAVEVLSNDAEYKDAGPAPENKAIEAAPANKGGYTASHKGGGKWAVFDPAGEQVGGLYSRPEADGLAAQYNETEG